MPLLEKLSGRSHLDGSLGRRVTIRKFLALILDFLCKANCDFPFNRAFWLISPLAACFATEPLSRIVQSSSILDAASC